jgi:hypothetical protein
VPGIDVTHEHTPASPTPRSSIHTDYCYPQQYPHSSINTMLGRE